MLRHFVATDGSGIEIDVEYRFKHFVFADGSEFVYEFRKGDTSAADVLTDENAQAAQFPELKDGVLVNPLAEVFETMEKEDFKPAPVAPELPGYTGKRDEDGKVTPIVAEPLPIEPIIG